MTLVAAFGGSLGCQGRPAAGPLAAAVGGLLAVAAVGHLPGDVGLAVRNEMSLLPVARALWPVVGALLAATWLATQHAPDAAAAAVGVAASAVATAALVAAFLRSGVIESVAATRSLASIGLAAAAGLAVMVAGGSPAAQGATTTAVWGLAAGSTLTSQTPDRQTTSGSTWAGSRRRRPLAGSGPAMASALAGMAGFYFLAPQFAWAYAVIAVGWFVVLAVPAATLPAGPRAAARLVQSAAGRPAGPGSRAQAVSLVATTAGLLAWPAVVAAVLVGPEAWRAGGPLTALAALGIAAGLTMVAAASVGARLSGDAARAVVLSAAAAGAIAAAAWGARMPDAPGLRGPGPVVGP